MSEHRIVKTLYHIHPLNHSGIENMDLGDVSGDLFFDMTVLMTPYQCINGVPTHPGAICDNREVIGPNIGVSQVLVEMDNRFGPYGTCNICTNGVSPLNTSHKCVGDEYVCDCSGGTFPPATVRCQATPSPV